MWTEIWRSDDNGMSWQNLGKPAKFPAGLYSGHAQCWTWDYNPEDGWVYIVSTGFQRNKGLILRRVRPEHIGDQSRYLAWADGEWGEESRRSSPRRERPGESCRCVDSTAGHGFSAGFLSSGYALGFRAIASPTAELGRIPLQRPVLGCAWDDEDHEGCRVAQLYGGYVLPGSRLDVTGGVGLVVSQWNTARGWPYRVMQFRVTLSSARLDTIEV